MGIYQPYTYLIGWSAKQKYYYGVRFAKKCNPSDLWKSYFTSSKYVKEFRKQFGEPDIIQIRKTFDCANKAILWESKVLRRINSLYDDKWFNKNIAGAIRISKFSEEHKRKISESNKGKHKKELALNASKIAIEVNKGKKRPEHSILVKAMWANGKFTPKRGKEHPLYKVGHKKESIEKIKKSIKFRPKACCIKCHKPNELNTIHQGVWTCHIANHHRNC
jgi:hypothetical protein